MVTLEKKQEILIGYLRENKSMRQLSKELHVSRQTVKKYIDNFNNNKMKLATTEDTVELSDLIEGMSEVPTYDTSSREKIKLTEEIKEEVDKLLKKNKEKINSGNRKQIMKNIDIHEYLVDKGYDIGYTTICNYIRENNKKAEAFIRQEYSLGETLEFDWGEVKLKINGKIQKIQIGLLTTACGSYHFAQLYYNQKMENFLDMHIQAFKDLGGIHKEVVYDNMKVAVKKFIGPTEKLATDDLIKLSIFYGFKYRFCNARSGNEKGHVENGVDLVRRKAFSFIDEFDTLEQAQKHLTKILVKINSKPRQWLEGKSPYQILTKERPHLLALTKDYDAITRKEGRVNKFSVIQVECNKYSVPDYLVGKFVNIRISTKRIDIYYKSNMVASHERSFNNHDWVVSLFHYTMTLKKKPGALANSTALKQGLSPKLQLIFRDYYSTRVKEFLELIEYINKNFIDEENLLKVISNLKNTNKKLVTTDNIISMIERKEDKVSEKILSDMDVTILNASINQIQEISMFYENMKECI